MIRLSSSFLISITVHTLLALMIFFTWKSFLDTKEKYDQEKICLRLCKFEQPKEVVKPPKVQKQQKTTPLKEITPPKKIEKPKIIEKPKKIEIPKEVEKPKKVERIKEPVPEKEIEKPKEIVKEQKTPSVQKSVKAVEEFKETPIVEENAHVSEEVAKETLTKEYIAVNIQEIARLLRENLYYPRSARKRNITGRVDVRFTLDTDSKVSNIEVIESNSDILSRAAVKTIEYLSSKFPKPKEKITLTVPITYTLN